VFEAVQNLVALFGLLAAAVGAAGVALVVAKQLNLDAHFLRHLNTPRRDPERTLALMLECAELAAREGLLRVEAHIASLREPLLARGIALAIEGKPEREMRSELDQAIQSAAADGAARSRFLATSGIAAQAFGIVLASALLAACLTIAIGTTGTLPALLLLVGGAAALLAIIGGTLWSEAAGMARAADALCDLIIAEGVLLLRSGRDPRSVAQTLSRFMPPASGTAPLAKAA
jgi:flagellar motor component MotA